MSKEKKNMECISPGVQQPPPPPSYPPSPPTYQPSVGIVIPPERNVDVIDERGAVLLHCHIDIGWFLFFLGFLCGAIPWYLGAVIFLGMRGRRREHPGLVACCIAAFLALTGFRVKFSW